MINTNTESLFELAPEATAAEKADRSAYAGELILTEASTSPLDSWETGLNNNVLVLGCSGGGKTRNHLKPNLLEARGSYVVLDSKGRLAAEMGPYLQSQGYEVEVIDFTTMEGTIGYDPRNAVRWRGRIPTPTPSRSTAAPRSRRVPRRCTRASWASSRQTSCRSRSRAPWRRLATPPSSTSAC